MIKRLDSEFYSQNAIILAPKLLGKYICHCIDGETLRYKITETECYYGFFDTACHAHRGKTKRNSPMFLAGGIAYIYLCYGLHNILNIVTGELEHPEGVMIRGISGALGPGRVTKKLKITTKYNGENLMISNRLWLEDDGNIVDYTTASRVGIDYASNEDRLRQWRFILKETE